MTGVEVWAPAFEQAFGPSWVPTVENSQAVFSDRVWCRLCEQTVGADRAGHAKAHARELLGWRHGRERARRTAARERLRQVNRERAFTGRVLHGRTTA